MSQSSSNKIFLRIGLIAGISIITLLVLINVGACIKLYKESQDRKARLEQLKKEGR